MLATASDPPPSSGLAPGWDVGDVAMLQELAEIGMDQARTLAAEARAHLTQVEAGEASPLTPTEVAKARLDFMRVSRAIRLTLALKAHAKGAPHGPTRAAILAEAAEPPGPRPLFMDRPLQEGDPTDEAGWLKFQADNARAELERVVDALAETPAEAERLWERIDRGIEREQESTRILGMHHHIVRVIVKDLGLGPIRRRPVKTADGHRVGEIVALPGEPSYEDPLIVPDGVDPQAFLRAGGRVPKPPDTG